MDLKRGFNRVFIVLWVAWAVYALILYPAQLGQEHRNIWSSAIQTCLKAKTGAGVDPQEAYKACEKEHQSLWDEGVRLYALPGRSAEAWLAYALLALVPPPLVYLVVGAAAKVVRWVSEGFQVKK
jgi:hypothetical protein